MVNAGATPVFADVDLNSGNISAETIAPKITSKTKAIICDHYKIDMYCNSICGEDFFKDLL